MANTPRPEEPPDANQTMDETRLGQSGSFPTSEGGTEAFASENLEAAPVGAGVRNSNVKRQKVSPEIDDPADSLSDFLKAAVRDAASELAKTISGKVADIAKKFADTTKKVADFLAPNKSARLANKKSEEAKKKTEAKVKTEPNKDAGAKTRTERFLEIIAGQIKQFTDVLSALLSPASNREAGSNSGYWEEGVQAVDGLKGLIQEISKNAPPQLQQYLKRNDLDESGAMLNWLDRLGAATRSGDEKALQSFVDEWKDFQKRMRRFLNQLGEVLENNATQSASKAQHTTDDATLRKSQQRTPTTPEAEQRKLHKAINGEVRRNQDFSIPVVNRKQNREERVLTNFEAEKKKLVRSNGVRRHFGNAVGAMKKQGNQKGRTLTSLQKLGGRGNSKHSRVDALVPVAKGSANVASKAGQVMDVIKMKVPVSPTLELVSKMKITR